MSKAQLTKLRDVGFTLLIFALLLGLMIMLNYSGSGVVDKDKAFRTCADLIKEPYFFDDEAIALSESSEDAGLRAEAIEANNMVNEIRAEAGLDPLEWDNNLETVASVRANEISEKFSHTRPNGKQWYTVNSKIQGGENLAYGFDNAEDVVEAWMNSPTHKDNILYDEFERGAISIYEEDGTYYWAQQYGY